MAATVPTTFAKSAALPPKATAPPAVATVATAASTPAVSSSAIHSAACTPVVALAASFAWGVLSIVLSPCHLSSIPLIIGFISGQGAEITARRAFTLSALFSAGILITIGAIGAVTAAVWLAG